MKKWVKGLLITAAVILVIGFGFLGAAFCTGFTSQAARETFHKYSGYFSDWDFVWDDDDDETEGSVDMTGVKEYTFSPQEIHSLELEVKKAHVKILPAEKEMEEKIVVQVSEKGRNDLEVRQEEGVLTIDYEPVFQKNQKVLLLYFPKDVQWDEFSLSLGAGKLECETDINANEFDLSIGAGQMTIGSVKTDEFDCEVGAGEGRIEYLDASKIQMEIGAGSFHATLAGSREDYITNFDVAAGSIQYGTEKYSGLANTHTYHPKDGTRVLEIECAAGETTIQFKEEI